MVTRPKACVFHRSPEKDYNVLVGDTVELRLRIKNCGGDRGNFYSDINKDGGAWIAKYNESLAPGELGTFLKKSFTMPNREVRVDFYGGHAWEGDWSEEFHYTAYLRPRKEYCTQEIEVRTKDGASVRATVDWGDGTSDSGATPKTFSHQYEVVIGKSYEIKVSASGYLREAIPLTLPCKPKITSILPKITETCEQRVRVETSDGAAARARLDWGDGTHEDFNTPKTCFYDRYEKGKTYTVTASATGYTSASKRIDRACISQFTLTLTKEEVPCSDWTTKSTCESHGCYWYNNSCHKFRPTVCSDYTDALTCAANNCYWWSDGKCHDTEEPPEGDPYKKWNCKTLREFDRSGKHIIEVECYCPSGESRTTQVVDYDWSWIETVMSGFCPSVKKDTVICDFNIYDAADKKVTDLVAGVRYAIKAYLCETCKIGILKGCATGKKVSGETLKLFLLGQAAELVKGTTNVDGYTSFYWTPSADIAGDNSIRLEFKGSANYNASESTKTVTVSADRFEVTVTEGVPIHGCCLTASRRDFKIPFTDICVLGRVKPGLDKVTKKVGDTVIFDTRDGLEVGKEYVINVGYEPPFPFDKPSLCGGYRITAKTDEFVEFGGVKKINVKGFYEAPGWQKWWCGVFDVAEVDCNSAWALAPLHILYAPRSWSLVMRGKELDGTTSGTPTKWDKAFVSLDCLVFLPVGRFKNIGGMGANLAKAVAKDARVLTWLDKTPSTNVAKAVTHASDEEYKVFIKLLEDGKFVDADTWVRWWADKIPTTKEVTRFTKWIDNLIVQSKKAIHPEDVLTKLDDAWKVIDSQADDIVKGSAKVLKEAKTEGEALKAIRGIIDSGMWDDLPRWFKKMKITKVYKPPIAGSEKFIEGGFSISDIGRFRVVTKAGSAEKLFKAGELLDEAKYCVGGEDALFRKFPEKFAFLTKHFTDDELKLAKKEVLAAANHFKGEEAKLVRAYAYSIEAFMDTKVATKGLDAFVRATVKGLGEVKGIGTVGDEGLETLIRILGEGTRKGAKNLTGGEAEAWERIIKLLENMPKRSSKLMGKELDKAAKAAFKMPFRDLSRWMKVSIIFSMLALGSTAFGVFTSFCLQLFMGEETIQWAGFGGIPLNNLLKDWDKKTPAEKTKIATIFRQFHTDRDTLHTNVERAMSIFLILCFPFATIYRLFLEADTINLAALDTSITYLEEGLESKDRGQCTIKVRANVDTVDIFLGGIPFTAGEPEPILATAGRIKQTARALYFTEVEYIPVFNKSYTLTVYGWKAGYLVAVQKFVIESNYTGYGIDWDLPELEIPTLELTPETGLLGRKGRTFENPFPYGMSDEVLGQVETKSQPWGLTPWNEYYGYGIGKKGKIRCETSPTGMTIWIKGGVWGEWTEYEFPTNATIPSVLMGDYQIKFTDPKGMYKDCLANDGKVITVRAVEEPEEAKCHMEPIVPPKPTAKFTFTPPKPTVNQTITFDATDSIPNGTTIISYDWDWGEVGKPHGTKKIETHAYIAKGTYRVVLTVENDKGGTDSFYQDVYVEIPTGNIKCYCEPAEYCSRNADIYVDGKKVDVTKESGYTYIKNQTPGVHTVKYNLLDIMECSGSVTVTADKDIDFLCQLKSKLPASQTAKVTAIVDGDGIKTDKTGTHEIRIIGYDAFECRVYPSDCTLMGKYGYEKLKSIIPVGTSVTLKIDQWLPLGFYNRVIADIFVGTKDIAAEMLKSCLVRFPEKKYRDKYYWDPWAEYARIWCDPEKVIPPDEYKPKIVEIETAKKTFKIKNNWLALWFLPEFVDSGGTVLGKATERKIEVGKTSTAITYFVGTHAIKLYARVDTKDDWTLVDTGYVAVAPPTKKTVTFKSVPSGASVTVVKKESARLVRALKRVRSKKVINV